MADNQSHFGSNGPQNYPNFPGSGQMNPGAGFPNKGIQQRIPSIPPGANTVNQNMTQPFHHNQHSNETGPLSGFPAGSNLGQMPQNSPPVSLNGSSVNGYNPRLQAQNRPPLPVPTMTPPSGAKDTPSSSSFSTFPPPGGQNVTPFSQQSGQFVNGPTSSGPPTNMFAPPPMPASLTTTPSSSLPGGSNNITNTSTFNAVPSMRPPMPGQVRPPPHGGQQGIGPPLGPPMNRPGMPPMTRLATANQQGSRPTGTPLGQTGANVRPNILPPSSGDFNQKSPGMFNQLPPPPTSHQNVDNSSQSSARPDALPVPFHGHGQYSHQVGMQLTTGTTPNNSEPPSQKSSRTPSPLVENYDALEGQLTPNKHYAAQQKSEDTSSSNTASFVNSSAGMMMTQQPVQAGPPAPGNLPPMKVGPPMSGAPQGQNITGIRLPMLSGPSVSGPYQPATSGPPVFGVRPQMPYGTPMGGARPPMSAGPPMSVAPPQMGTGPPMFGSQPPLSTGPPMMGVQPPMSTGPPKMGMGPPSAQDMNTSRTGTYGSPSGYPNMNSQPGPMSGPMSGTMSGPLSAPMGSQFTQSQGTQGGYQQPPGPGNQFPYNNQMNSGPPNSAFEAMGLQDTGGRSINLLQEKRLIPADGVETPKPRLPHDFKKANCNPDVFRCTLTAIPQSSSLLNKSRLPLGILIHPFKDLSEDEEGCNEICQLPVIQSSVIVRCRSCRTYINPFVTFVDQRRWKCNLCYRISELPEEFQFDPVTKTYGEPQRRPEIKSSTIEFIAPSEYMLRPPQPAIYLYLLDVSFNAIETGYLRIFCQTLLEELDKIPKDGRTQIGFIVYDRALHFFNLASGLSQPQMLIVSDIEEVFLPCPDDLLVNLQESKDLVIDLLNQLPNMFEGNLETGSALGPALQAAYKLMAATGGRVTVMQTVLPTVGSGSLQSREDINQRTAKNVSNLGPATDFYKKLALDCSAQQIAVDLFMLNGQYADLASISGISKYSGGQILYYPSFHSVKNRSLGDKYEEDLRRYFTRKIGFEAVMRIRCTKGLSIHTFHGNFFVRSTDLLSLPNINPDAGFGMQMSIEDSLTDTSTACFQAALLYTSSKGERRIRVHTMCLPITNQINEVIAGADQRACVCLLAKMACDRSASASLSDAREALINSAIDCLSAFSGTLQSSQRLGGLPAAFSIRLWPAFILALLKSTAFRHGVSTNLDERVFAMQQCKSLPLQFLMQTFFPDLYAVHNINECPEIMIGDEQISQPILLHLSSSNIDRNGVYLLDTFDAMYLYVGSAVSDQFCKDVFDMPNFLSIPDGMVDLPELDNTTSEKLRSFVSYLMDKRPGGPTFLVIREDSKHRMTFFRYMIEDRTESSMSYYEFLQHIQRQVKS